ncbi:hypothetical protein LINGRAHAP2_LOCUS10011, partial [Linum grandiflorum]
RCRLICLRHRNSFYCCAPSTLSRRKFWGNDQSFAKPLLPDSLGLLFVEPEMPSEDSKPVKNEMADDGDLDDRSLSTIMQARRKNPTNAGSITPKSRPKLAKSEKEEDDFDQLIKPKGSSQPKSKITKVKKDDDDEDDEDEKPISKRNSASKADKKELNNKKVKKSEGAKAKESAAAEQNGKKREKKVYDLPGQRRDPPEERDPLRIFYETLYKQVPNSEMAQFWMMESGLLPKDLAQKVYDNKLKKRNHKLSSPMKRVTPTTKKTNGSTATKKKPSPAASSAKSKAAPKESKKRKAKSDSENDSDDDFVVNAILKKQRAS